MLYVLALIGAVTVAVLLWKAFGPQLAASRKATVAPDDDPEFLSELGRQGHNPDDETGPPR